MTETHFAAVGVPETSPTRTPATGTTATVTPPAPESAASPDSIPGHALGIGIYRPNETWEESKKPLSLDNFMQSRDEWENTTKAGVGKEVVKNLLGVAAITALGVMTGGVGLGVIAAFYGGAALIAGRRLYGDRQHRNAFFENSLNHDRLSKAVHAIANDDGSSASKELAVKYSAARDANNVSEQLRILKELQEQTGYVIDFSKFHKDFDENTLSHTAGRHSYEARSKMLAGGQGSPPPTPTPAQQLTAAEQALEEAKRMAGSRENARVKACQALVNQLTKAAAEAKAAAS